MVLLRGSLYIQVICKKKCPHKSKYRVGSLYIQVINIIIIIFFFCKKKCPHKSKYRVVSFNMFVVPRLHQLKHGHLCTKSS